MSVTGRFAPKAAVRTKPAVFKSINGEHRNYDHGDHHVHGSVGRWWLR